MSTPLLKIAKLCAGYGASQVLFDIDMAVRQGEIVALVGSNGAGKTTLLRAVSRVIESDGRIEFDGEDITGLPPEAVFARRLVQVPEGRQLFGAMTVEENLQMGAYACVDKNAVQTRFESVYTLFPILGRRRRQLAGSLSGGEQQMCAIGRALMCEPKLLMIDEMSLGLAPVIVDRLLEILGDIVKRGVTVLLVEQDVFAAFSVADRAYVMETGRMTREGPVCEFVDNPMIREAYLGV
ncbi:MAG: ABC transporter ATP-binding protein [Hyphomicrobiales bacterium]